MATLKPYDLQTEKELHGIIQREIDALEDGLRILKYEMAFGVGCCRFSNGLIISKSRSKEKRGKS